MDQNKVQSAKRSYKDLLRLNYTVYTLMAFILMYTLYRAEYYVIMGLCLVLIMLLIMRDLHIKSDLENE